MEGIASSTKCISIVATSLQGRNTLVPKLSLHSFPSRVCPFAVCVSLRFPSSSSSSAPSLSVCVFSRARSPPSLSLSLSLSRSPPMSSDSDNEPSAASSILHNVMENLQHLPASQSHYVPGSSASSSSGGLFGRPQRRVHDLLGGGHSADVLLWRKKNLSAGFLVGATVVWFLFEWIGYHFISVISFLLLGFVVVLFAWSNGAAFLKRPPPPVPKFQLSDRQVHDIAKNISIQVNKSLVILHEIVIGKDVKRFLKLVGVLSFLVVFGSWFHLLTLVYLAVVAAHTLPMLYEKHGDSIDQLADSLWKEANIQYKKFDAAVLSKIPRKQPTFQRKTN